MKKLTVYNNIMMFKIWIKVVTGPVFLRSELGSCPMRSIDNIKFVLRLHSQNQDEHVQMLPESSADDLNHCCSSPMQYVVKEIIVVKIQTLLNVCWYLPTVR